MIHEMFKIKYSIVDDFEILKSLTASIFDDEYEQVLGFFKICFGIHQEGSYYHENPLQDGEEGSELLDYWFDIILQAVLLLESGEKYVAFKEIETVNRWLEFVRREDNILINVAVDDLCKNNLLLITEKDHFTYVEPLDFIIPYKSLKEEVLIMSEKFLEELKEINRNLGKTRLWKKLKKKITKIKESDCKVR